MAPGPELISAMGRAGGRYEATGGAPSGSVTVKVAPFPAPALATSMVPPCISTSGLARAIPRPSPPCRLVRDMSPWLKRSKTAGRKSGSMPRPESLTIRLTRWPARFIRNSTRPPSGVNLIAFCNRFQTTCRSRAASQSNCFGALPNRAVRSIRLAYAGRAPSLACPFQHQPQVSRREFEFELAADDARRVEQVFDQLLLHSCVAIDDLAVARDHRRVMRFGARHPHVAENGVERRA